LLAGGYYKKFQVELTILNLASCVMSNIAMQVKTANGKRMPLNIKLVSTHIIVEKLLKSTFSLICFIAIQEARGCKFYVFEILP